MKELDFESSASTIPPQGLRGSALASGDAIASQWSFLVSTITLMMSTTKRDRIDLAIPENAVARTSSHIHISIMIRPDQWRRFIDQPFVEWTLFAIGVLLLLVSPLVGAIPGPGGVIVAGIGLALVLKTSSWAKRRYVRFKRWQPKAGRWTDWALRRPSAQRREVLRKGGNPAIRN